MASAQCHPLIGHEDKITYENPSAEQCEPPAVNGRSRPRDVSVYLTMTGAMVTIDDGPWTAIKHTNAIWMRISSCGSPTVLRRLLRVGQATHHLAVGHSGGDAVRHAGVRTRPLATGVRPRSRALRQLGRGGLAADGDRVGDGPPGLAGRGDPHHPCGHGRPGWQVAELGHEAKVVAHSGVPGVQPVADVDDVRLPDVELAPVGGKATGVAPGGAPRTGPPAGPASRTAGAFRGHNYDEVAERVASRQP
jgi:hypothetical protein